MANPYLGEIRMFGGNFAIRQWALCNGQSLSISSNTALFAIIGTTYGGNGTTTFNLPDLRGRMPVHVGQGAGLSTYTLGEVTGNQSVTMTSQQMATHTHTFTPHANNGAAGSSRPGNGYPANSGATPVYAASQDTSMAPQTISNVGGGQPIPVIQPVLCVTFLIALAGIFPTRN
jgi:microcystin-dependent protein